MECPCGFDPSIQRISVGGAQVGIAGLEDIFRNWLASGKKVQDLSEEQIIQALQKHNYIIPRLKNEYAEAVRSRYTAYSEASKPR